MVKHVTLVLLFVMEVCTLGCEQSTALTRAKAKVTRCKHRPAFPGDDRSLVPHFRIVRMLIVRPNPLRSSFAWISMTEPSCSMRTPMYNH